MPLTHLASISHLYFCVRSLFYEEQLSDILSFLFVLSLTLFLATQESLADNSADRSPHLEAKERGVTMNSHLLTITDSATITISNPLPLADL